MRMMRVATLLAVVGSHLGCGGEIESLGGQEFSETGRINCRKRTLVAPMVSATVQSPMRIHLTASSDPAYYTVRDALGAIVYEYPSRGSVYIGPSIREFTIEGLAPGASYQVAATVTDPNCGTTAVSQPVAVTTLAIGQDITPPSVTKPYLQWYWAGGTFPTVEIKASDETGLASVEILADGLSVYKKPRIDGWVGSATTRPIVWNFPSNPYHASAAKLITAVVTDGVGHMTTTSETLVLPGYLGL